MNNLIKQLAEEAGFCFWSNESWKPVGAQIDWASNYDEQFEKFLHLLKRELLDMLYESDKFYDFKDSSSYLRYRVLKLLGDSDET